jgi:hypothetical protein
MQPWLIVPMLFVYLTIGVIWSGIVTNALRGDGGLLPITLLFWPITMPIGLLMALYAAIIGKDVSRML